jgi:16S rRNA (guanine527-N7)-methyltransferase
MTTLEGLVARYELPPAAVEQLAGLVDLLVSDPRAPTTIREPAAVLDEHLADSLIALELVEVRTASAAADIGSGAGMPGLALAIALPSAEFALVESSGRKCEFMEHVVRTCRIPNARVVNARVEAWTDGRGRHDVAMARAVGPLDVVAEYGAPLLHVGGSLVVWRGRRDSEAEASAAVAAQRLGLELAEPRRVVPFPGARHRNLHLMSKVRETPAEFPRRPGLAVKRPLGVRRGESDRIRR